MEKTVDIELLLEQQEQVLVANRDFIIKHLDADDVIDELIRARLIGKNSAQRIGLVTMSRTDKNRIIFEQLSIAGPGALKKFCDVLRKDERQTFIAVKVEQSLHSTTAAVQQPCLVNVKRLKTRYLRLRPTAKTDWPKHKVTQYIRLAIVEKEDVTLRDENLNEVTKLTLQGDVDRILKKKQPLGDLREIFYYEKKPCPRLIVIMGGPGIGKTTLAHEICLRWARDGFLSDDFDVIALIPLRSVHQRSLEEVFAEFIGEDVFQEMKKSAGSRCLIILEGLDEMSTEHQESDRFFNRLIRDCTILEESNILITSRPHACSKLNADRQVEVIGFGADQIEEFIKRSFPNDKHAIRKLLRQLNDYLHIKSLCYVPLNLVMITDIYQCSQDKKLPSTITELYRLFLVMILQREDKKTVFPGASLTAANSESLKKMLPGIPINAIGTVFLLCRLSFCGFFDWYTDKSEEDRYGDVKKWKDPKIIFTMADLAQCGIEVTSEFDGFSLLKATHLHEVPTDTSSYNFSHLTIQEFLTSLYITLLPQQEQISLMNDHFQSYPNVFIFLCGLTRLDCNEMYQIVYSKLMQTNANDVVSTAKCLYEGQSTSQSAVPFTLDMSFNQLTLYDCYCASHVISHYPVSEVNMAFCYMGDTGVAILGKQYSDSRSSQIMEVLNFSKNDLTAAGMVDVIKMVKTSSATLRELDVDYNHNGDDWISKIAELLQSSKTLARLDVSHCDLTAQGASCVGELLKVNNSLQELDMMCNPIGDDGISSIADGLQCNNSLIKLDVDSCGFSVKGASSVGELLKVNNSLQKLKMRDNPIGDDGMSTVADGLQCNNTLMVLNITRCGFSVKGAISISQAPMVNQTLLELDIGGNDIKDEGITAIAGSLSNSSITVLDVMRCGITFTGVRSLAAALSTNQNIRELWLMNNPITVDGARLIMKSAVDNGVCKYVGIDNEYEDNQVKEMRTILCDRGQDTNDEGSSEDDDCTEEKSLENNQQLQQIHRVLHKRRNGKTQ